MAQLKDLIVNGPSRFIGDVYATTFTGNLAGNATSATSAATAGTASNADTVGGYTASSLWRSDGGAWNPWANIILGATANDQEWSFDIYRNGKTGCFWHVWDSSLSTMLQVNADSGKVYAPYGFVGDLVGNATSSSSCSGNAASAYVLAHTGTKALDECVSNADGLQFWRTTTDVGLGGGDGMILTWRWAAGSVNNQLYLDNNPSGICAIRGRNNNNSAWTNWKVFAFKSDIPTSLPANGGSADYATSAGSAGSASSASSATYAHYFPTKYDGGDKANPQTYFNENIGLRAAMTRYFSTPTGSSSWYDTLWINGYAGGDVPYMCAIHTIRNGSPRAFISAQSNRDTTYGTWYEFITSYNIGNQSVNYATSAGSASSAGVATNASNLYSGAYINGSNANGIANAPYFIMHWPNRTCADVIFDGTFKVLGHSSDRSGGYVPAAFGTTTVNGKLHAGCIGNSNNYLVKPVADYISTADAHTGCITITLPSDIGNTMVSMWIDVYSYITNQSFSVHCGGYTYTNSTWQYNPFAMVYGANHRVRFGHNGTSFVIYIGETNSYWSYPQVSVRDVTIGFHGNYDKWSNDWSIGFSTSVSNVTADITHFAYTTKNLPSSFPANGGTSTASGRLNSPWISDLNSPNWGQEGALTYDIYASSAANKPVARDNANWVLTMNCTRHGSSGYYGWQIAGADGSDQLYARGFRAGSFDGWRKFAWTSDLSSYYTKTEIDNMKRTVYVGSAVPTSTSGYSNGDIYLVR